MVWAAHSINRRKHTLLDLGHAVYGIHEAMRWQSFLHLWRLGLLTRVEGDERSGWAIAKATDFGREVYHYMREHGLLKWGDDRLSGA